MENKKILPFGTWPSPITAAMISRRLRLEEVQWSADGKTLVWSEGRPDATVLVAQTGSAATRYLTDDPAPSGGVGYGGGIFTVARSHDMLVFPSGDGRLYRRGLNLEKPFPISPAINAPGSGVAAPAISPDGKSVAYIYSDGKTDLIGLADASGEKWPVQLARGADFYMQPAWSPTGEQLAWVEWDHPNMPWDGTRVQLAQVKNDPPQVTGVQTVGGGTETPAQQPMFSPDGRWLSFIEENGEWPDLILVDLSTGRRSVLVKGSGFDISFPSWVQGTRTMGWSYDSQRIFFVRWLGPTASLWMVNVKDGKSKQIDTPGCTVMVQLAVNPTEDTLAFLASGPNRPIQVVIWNGHEVIPVANSTAATYDQRYLPVPREITWNTTGGGQSYGLYYPPANPNYDGTGAPPTIFHIHGGPTGTALNSLNFDAAYFTSRGYAWIEVNYRGSTGFGREYRNALRHRWGDFDVEDAASCARSLGEQGLADPKKMVIMGGSAGGYTVLNTLIRYPGLFKAGVCLYGVTNLFTLDIDTHKFEQHYTASMVGQLPEASEQYHAWSPIFQADRIRDSLYVFQGSEDKVVPPNQAEEIIAKLREYGVTYQYKVYQGEGHGFRKPENIADYLKETERFLQQQVVFA